MIWFARAGLEHAPLGLGELLLACLEGDVSGRVDEAVSNLRRPCAVGTGLRKRVAHRGQLVGHGALRRGIDRGPGKILPCEREEASRDHPAGRTFVGFRAARPGQQEHHDELVQRTSHPEVFGLPRKGVKARGRML